jgi:ATP-dependent Lon protease
VDDLLDLGLFPLELVILPGEKVPLHLFEPRYRQLYADCVLDDRPFVIVQTGPAGPADVGCSTRFETLVRRFEDGRLNVIVQGVGPVELVEESEGRLYFSAKVRALADDLTEASPELAAKVLSRFRSLAGLPDDAMPPAPEGVPLSYAIAGAFELPAGPKQELLESRDEGRRLAMVDEILSAVDQELQHARLAAERASTNGKVATS